MQIYTASFADLASLLEMTSSSKYNGQTTKSGKHYYYDENSYDEDGNVLTITKKKEPYIWRTQDPTRSQQCLLKHPSTYAGQYCPGPLAVEPRHLGHSKVNPRMKEFESGYQVFQRKKQTPEAMLWDDLHSSWEEHICNYNTYDGQIPFQPYQFEYKVHQSKFLGSKNSTNWNKTTYNQPHMNQNVVTQQTSVGPGITTGYGDERFIYDVENDNNYDADELTVEQYLLASSCSGVDTRNIQKKSLLMKNKEVSLNGVPLDIFGLPMDRGDDVQNILDKDFVNKSVPTIKYQESNAPRQVSHKQANNTGKILQHLSTSQFNTVSSAAIYPTEVTESGSARDEWTLHMKNRSQKQLQQNEWLAPQQVRIN